MSRYASDDEFLKLWEAHKSVAKLAKILGINERNAHKRRRKLEGKFGISLPVAAPVVIKHNGRIDLRVENGHVIVFSDAHYWPGIVTTAHRALLMMCSQLKPAAIVNNGDAFDGASISRFPRPFFDEGKPMVNQELDVVDTRLGEIQKSSPKSQRIWNLGNHDLRFEARLAANSPQYEGVQGFHLKDHFPEWRPAWSCFINDDVEIRHRYKGGIHATHNNVMSNHHSTVTGHLHALQVRTYTDGAGKDKFGVDTGTLADIGGPQFSDYLEGRTPNWRSGFVVLTFKDGRLLTPETVKKYDEDTVEFRGHLLDADTGQIK